MLGQTGQHSPRTGLGVMLLKPGVGQVMAGRKLRGLLQTEEQQVARDQPLREQGHRGSAAQLLHGCQSPAGLQTCSGPVGQPAAPQRVRPYVHQPWKPLQRGGGWLQVLVLKLPLKLPLGGVRTFEGLPGPPGAAFETGLAAQLTRPPLLRLACSVPLEPVLCCCCPAAAGCGSQCPPAC